MIRKGILIIACLTLGVSCKKQNQDCQLAEEIEAMPLHLNVVRLERLFFEDISKESVSALLEEYAVFSQDYLLENEFDSREEMVREIIELHEDPGMQELYQEVNVYFNDFSSVEKDLENAFKAIKFHYPEFNPPTVYTYVSGFTNDIYITNDLLVISLDYFLPADHRFQPIDLPAYITRRYDIHHLVPTIVTAISARFNETDLRDNTLLAEMIFYGKSYHFTKEIMPCVPDDYIIGYTPEDIHACYANEEMIYAHFVENELFFETNPFEIRKYTGEAPFTDEISLDAPGRIGRWIGWNIVDDYRTNNNLSLQEVMKQNSAREIFRRSGYKPR